MPPTVPPADAIVLGIGLLVICTFWFVVQRAIEKSGDGEMGFSLFPLIIGFLALCLALSGAATLIHGGTTNGAAIPFQPQNWGGQAISRTYGCLFA